MELFRDTLLLAIVLILFLGLTPQGQNLVNGQTSQISSLEQTAASIDSNTNGISNLLTLARFDEEDFAQESTLSDNEQNTANIDSNTDQLEAYTDELETLIEQNNNLTTEINNRDGESAGLFGGVDVNNRQTLFHIEATVPLNDRRNDWTGNVSWTGDTYKLTGTSNLSSNQRGEYQPGSTAEMGQMVIVDSIPDSNEVLEWGYMNGENGFYYGVNSTCFYVELQKNGNVLESVCQNQFNVNTANVSKETSYNPEGHKISLQDANMYQADFAWYGGGIIEMAYVHDDEDGQDTIPLHRFDIANETSLGEVSLPIKERIRNDPDNSTSLQIGGRQFSIQDNYEKTARQSKFFVESMTASSTEYTPAISFQIEQGFNNVNIDLLSFSSTPTCDVNAQVRYDTVLTGANFVQPELINQNESLVKVDKSATSWQVGGEPSGQYLDFAQLAGGQNANKPVSSVQTEKVSTVIGDDEIVTLAFKADDTSCDVTDITVSAEEDY